VIGALRGAVGDEGAVLFPCLTFNGSVTEYLRTTAMVDLRNVTIHTGTIPAAAWYGPDVIRSIHPTHPVAGFGRKAQEILAVRQSGQGPLGTDSPFYRAALAGGKILMIGVSLDTCSTLHCVEEIAASYVYSGEVFNVPTIDYEGNEHTIVVKGYCVGMGRRFSSIQAALIEQGIMEIKPLGLARMLVIQARAMIEKTLEMIKQDEYLLVSEGVKCR
jgi:aminoglycoside 3-N-acetyltransferase